MSSGRIVFNKDTVQSRARACLEKIKQANGYNGETYNLAFSVSIKAIKHIELAKGDNRIFNEWYHANNFITELIADSSLFSTKNELGSQFDKTAQQAFIWCMEDKLLNPISRKDKLNQHN